ncbi:MAG: DUF1963 domain-containing protein [Myxococcales bacterium]
MADPRGRDVVAALVSQGIYLGSPPPNPQAELDRLAESAPEWRLLLQLTSDGDLDWMWGDCGNLYWWIRAQDAVAGAWERWWIQLQCS